MDTFSRCSLVLICIVFEIVALGSPTPVWDPQSSTGLGRNIRHLPCVSRRSGETGVCMFAISCAKANGTHLGTCIDRFYFGSCCKLAIQNEDIAEPLDSNHLFEEVLAPSTENYHLSTFQSVQTVKNATQKPVLLSTTTPRTTPETTTPKPSKKPSSTSKPITTASSLPYTHKPVTSSRPPVTKPYTQASTTKPRPSGKPPPRPQTTSKPSSVNKPPLSNAPSSKPPVKPPPKPVKPSNATSSKPIPPKPSNATKPSKPLPTKRPTVSTSTKPVHSQSHHKPTQSPSKPISKPTQKPYQKPSTTPKPITKPPLKPVPLVTTVPVTDPNFVKVPVVTVPPSQKPSSEATVISNDVIQRPSNNKTNNATLEAEEESSNIISESLTTSSPLLVTWTTVDEVPQPPLPKPGSTPSSGPEPTPIKNETEAGQTTAGTSSVGTTGTTSSGTTATTENTQSSQTWVQVSVSTPGPSTAHPKPEYNATATTPESSTVVPVTETSGANLTTASTIPQTNVTVDPLQNEIQNLNMTNYLDVCGRRLFPQSRIVGGDKATFGKWPWQISLRQWRTSTYLHKCGAALLNENWAITAAHCVENVAPSDLLLRLGEHDLSLEDEPYGYQERRVQIVASHPQFDPRTFEYDLALLRFYEPVTFQPNIIPVCVPQDDTNFVGSTAYVTGWGRLYEDGPLPSVLQEVSVPVINNTVCETMYRAAGYIEHIPEIFICAGWKKGGFDSCEGDSGGPMVIQRPDKRWLLAGVISWGIGCAEPNQPGVYTRISEFRGWINQILQF